MFAAWDDSHVSLSAVRFLLFIKLSCDFKLQTPAAFKLWLRLMRGDINQKYSESIRKNNGMRSQCEEVVQGKSEYLHRLIPRARLWAWKRV